ncbi:maltose acetyltransferase-domain-containing protein [Aspergillus aurantiobrunneus]
MAAATEKRPEIIEIARGLNHVPMCEDYERMVSGMLYNPLLPKLAEARHRCRGVATDYNQLDTKTVPYDQIGDRRLELLRNVVGNAGEGTFVEPPIWPDYGCNIAIGKECFINFKYILTIPVSTSVPVSDDKQFHGPRHKPHCHRRPSAARPQREHLHSRPRHEYPLASEIRRVRTPRVYWGRLLDWG